MLLPKLLLLLFYKVLFFSFINNHSKHKTLKQWKKLQSKP